MHTYEIDVIFHGLPEHSIYNLSGPSLFRLNVLLRELIRFHPGSNYTVRKRRV